MAFRIVEHNPKWEPTKIRIDAAGNTKPGYHCVHMLENGQGICDGTIFDPADEVGTHSCVVEL